MKKIRFMQLKHFFVTVAVFLCLNQANAQLGGLLKKKKDKEEKAVADTATHPSGE